MTAPDCARTINTGLNRKNKRAKGFVLMRHSTTRLATIISQNRISGNRKVKSRKKESTYKHKDLRMAARYQRLSRSFLADAVARLDTACCPPALTTGQAIAAAN
jgi:hypothetical protein